jgi:aryl-alcohol dehydrogenase-like predicted oxidoreductase
MPWLREDELRIGLGCMRLPRGEETAAATVAAALDSGITVFDTARSYEGNEAFLARALRGAGARVVTKGGMARPDGAWVPDGRARTIRADCEASLAALDGVPIDLFLLHAPDSRTPWRTSVRALAKLVDDGLVARVGVCNVTRGQLDEAAALAPVAAVQVGLSVLDDRALRGGVVERCAELGIALVAHSPLGGPRRFPRLARDATLTEVAREHEVTPAEAALAWVLALGPNVVAIPGARRPETARSAARAASLVLAAEDRARLGGGRPRAPRSRRRGGDVVLVMGIPGAGKSHLAAGYADRGHVRLNRDERGGTLREVADALDDVLAGGAREVVLDNTYLTRASRSHVVETAERRGVRMRCVWLDTPLAAAQVNLVERLLDRFGELPQPEDLKRLSRSEPGVLTPTQQMRAVRELEPPGEDEGFASIERIAFERVTRGGAAGVFVAGSAVERMPLDALERGAPILVFDWRPDGLAADLEHLAALLGPAETAVCPHGGGPPICWCRPPLPGLPLAFARRHGVDPERSLLVGASPAHRTLANALGARYVAV